MKIKLTISWVIFLSLPMFVSATAFSMDRLESQEAPVSEVKSMSSILPIEAQRLLTEMGHETLRNLIIDDHYDVSKSGLYDRFSSTHPRIMEEVKYSKIAEWMPSKIIRGYFASTDDAYVTRRKDHLMAMIGICWAMVDLAKDQRDFFQRGSFTIVDPAHRITNFFLEYVKLTTAHEDPKEHSFWFTQSNFAYRRDPERHGSSHHYGRSPESQFGIDIRFKPQDSVLKFLPFEGTHFLFGMLDVGGQDEPLFFLKLEDMGMGSVLATLLHGLNFLDSQSPVTAEARREKDINSEIIRSFKDFMETSQTNGSFKTIRSMYLKALDLRAQTEATKRAAAGEKTTTIKLDDSIFGSDIGSFHDLGGANEDQQGRIAQGADDFIRLVNAHYPNGNNHLRVGNEVIIDLRPLWTIYR